MAGLKTWITYLTPDDEVKAVEVHPGCLGEEVFNIKSEGNVVLGTPYFMYESQAIAWAEQGCR